MQNDSYDIFDKHNWTVGKMLRHQKHLRGEKTFLNFDESGTVTFEQADDMADRVAHGLMNIGIEKGDRVAVFLPNGAEYCNAWFGISRAGAVHVAINTDYKGVFLRHVLTSSRASVLICEASYLSRIRELENDLPHLNTLIVSGDCDVAFTRLKVRAFDDLCRAPAKPVDVGVSYRDLGCIMYTSGTTGPSKGVLMPHAHNYLFGLGAVENLALTSDDVYYISLPLYHANGLFMQLYAALIVGATTIVKSRFSASAWISDIQRYGATVTNTLGVMSEFVLNQPENLSDKEHRLRTISVAPITASIEEKFKHRFGIRNVVGVYGMTEVNIPLYAEIGVSKPGSCGKEYSRYYDVRIVDPETDEQRPSGQIGEVVVRPKQPFGFMAGYDDLDDQTLEAWRNFWFHTGDAATMDKDGYVYFVDRIKDSIRRRGENISSHELESVIQEHHAVDEVAAIAVNSDFDGGEDEVKIVVVLKQAGSLNESELATFCDDRLPGFAVPRYIEFVQELPKTPTNKVMKKLLRDAGVQATTWDRQG